MLRCLKCGGLLENKLRKYHPECWKVVEHELGENRNKCRKAFNKLSNREKRTLVYIQSYLSNPTHQQISDICSYYGVEIGKINDNLNLLEYIDKYEVGDCYRKGTYDVLIT